MMSGRIFLGLMLVAQIMAGSASSEVVQNTRFQPTIWVDPDGCEHWVMDTGLEGYMSLRLQADGKPVCHKPVQDGRYVYGPDGLVVVEPRP
jgi:hypothetical protein